MFYAFLGIIVGVILGVVLPFSIPLEYSRYTAIAILAILDSISGGISAQVKKEFNAGNFVFGLLFYMVLTSFFVYLGDKLNINIYLGVIVVFMFRIMQNIGFIRSFYFEKFFNKDKKETKAE